MKKNQCKIAAPVTRGWQVQDQSANCKPSFLLTLSTLKGQSYCARKQGTKNENVLTIKHHVNCNSTESKSFIVTTSRKGNPNEVKAVKNYWLIQKT